MRKLIEADLIDIFPTENGFIYLARETLSNGEMTGVFHKFDREEEKIYQSDVFEYIDEAKDD